MDVAGDGLRLVVRERWAHGHRAGEAREVAHAEVSEEEVAAGRTDLVTDERVAARAVLREERATRCAAAAAPRERRREDENG
ncbi:MAG TPA: hypothetical protein VE982_00470 [Gaiellaceae bacterium]|nr:hypothetical protein [Gaiellaceae bacterium]